MHQKFPIWIHLWDTFIVLGGFLKHSVSLFGWTSRKVNNRLAGKRGFFFHHYHLCRASKEWCLNVVSRQEISFSYYLSLSLLQDHRKVWKSEGARPFEKFYGVTSIPAKIKEANAPPDLRFRRPCPNLSAPSFTQSWVPSTK